MYRATTPTVGLAFAPYGVCLSVCLSVLANKTGLGLYVFPPPGHGSNTFRVRTKPHAAGQEMKPRLLPATRGSPQITRDPILLVLTRAPDCSAGAGHRVLGRLSPGPPLRPASTLVPTRRGAQAAPPRGPAQRPWPSRAGLAPLPCPHDSPLVSGPRAGDGVILAVSEKERGLQKEKKAYKTRLSSKIRAFSPTFGWSLEVCSREAEGT